ncbi:MAG: type I polyketide synthase, partial [Bacteroidota bacterium]
MSKKPSYNGLELAIIGMSCRMPAAKNPQEFWNNLTAGKECVQVLTAEEARAKGIPESQIEDENFVQAQSEFPGKETFDAAFFGYRPDEASMMNPALRTFHECIWEALEDAGYDPQSINGSIGLFAGGGEDLNWRVYTKIINESQKVNDIALSMVSSKDYLTTVPSYKLDLRGPSMSIQTACSTSLVSVHMACKSLLMGESKLAIAGGISLLTDQTKGYFYEEGSIVSKDGHCRAFDQQANGTIRGEGAGLVVLKRLKEAIADKDHIYAIIKGGAINNDGLRKVGYTAPSIDGQAECIKAALRFSRVDPSSIGYVEAHGTGTKLGDPIEVKALNAAYGMGKGPASCPIGSVKTNIGHLDTAAGIAGLLKAALALKHKQIPPSLNFTAPNPAIPFDKGPFFVNDRLREWREGSNGPRRAAVSSLGLGGTNAHLILEEAPFQQPSKALSNKPTLLTLSAKSSASLQTYISRLKAYLLANPETDLRDMTHSLQLGRRDFSHRFATTFGNREELLERLSATDLAQRIHPAGLAQKSAVFMFSGAGTQYVNMGKELYHSLPVFKKTMDQGFQILESITNIDYRSIIYPEQDGDGRINEMLHTQPVLFLFEYATARLLMHFGVTPTYMIGHSLGEYAAACLSGIFSFEDALRLVVRRGELMDRMPAGAMLSVQLAESELAPYLNEDIALAAINGPNQSVLSGSVPAIETLMGRLEKDEQVFVRLHASIAGHSHMIDELLPDFEAALRQVNFGSLELPFVSGVSGTLIESKEACSVEYWLRHMRQTVRFANGIDHLLAQNPNLLFIETGSSNSLSILLREKW